eukprot:COSAG02_NODE_840_length_16627_cov_11.279828_15_plen_122_part_00
MTHWVCLSWQAVDAQLIFYVSRVLFGFYMNGGSLYCRMPDVTRNGTNEVKTYCTVWADVDFPVVPFVRRSTVLHANPFFTGGRARVLPSTVLHRCDAYQVSIHCGSGEDLGAPIKLAGTPN